MPTMSDVSPPDKVKFPGGSRFSNPELCVRIPALFVGISCALFVLVPDAAPSSLPLRVFQAALLGAVSAWLFGLTLGPWLGWWRRAMPSLAVVPAAPLLVAILMFWNLAVPSLFGLASSDPDAKICEILDALLLKISSSDAGFIAAIGLAGCCLAKGLVALPPDNSAGGHRLRRCVGIAVLTLVGVVCCRLAPIAQGGYCLDSELERRLNGHLYDSNADVPDQLLPAEFRSSSEVRNALARSRAGDHTVDWSSTRRRWLAVMRNKGQVKQFWRDEEAVALARFADRYFDLAGDKVAKGSVDEQLEITLWSDLVLLDAGLRRQRSLAQLASDADAPASTWERLLAIALTREGLDEGPPIDVESGMHDFVLMCTGQEDASTESSDRVCPDGLLASMLRRYKINQAWQAFLRRPAGKARAILNPDVAARLSRSDSENDWRDARRQNVRHELLAAIVVMEWQRQRALGQTLTAEVLRPEIASLLMPYEGWFQFKADRVEAEVKVRTTSRRGLPEEEPGPYRVFQPTALPLSSGRGYPVSKADMVYGARQVELMMHDRPKMKQLVKRGDVIYEWAARQFAGASCGCRVRWDSGPVDLLLAAGCNNFDGEKKTAQIRVRAKDVGGAPLSAGQMWAGAVFELINIGNGPLWHSDKQYASAGLMSREIYVSEGAKLEYLSCVKQARFYRTLWRPHLVTIGQTSEPTEFWWREAPRNFERWRLDVFGRDGYPEVPFGISFDELQELARIERELAESRRKAAEEEARRRAEYDRQMAVYNKIWGKDRPPFTVDPFQVCDADVSFGKAQVDQLLEDRPDMQALLGQDDRQLASWLSKQFAGTGCGYRLRWSSTPIDMGREGEIRDRVSLPTLDASGRPIDSQEAWALLVSQLYHIRNDAERSALHSARKRRELSQESVKLALARLDHKAKLGLKSFFYQYWYLALTDRGITPDERYWALDTPNTFEAGEAGGRIGPARQPRKAKPTMARPWSADGSDDPALSVRRR